MAESNYHGRSSWATFKASGGAFVALVNVIEWSYTLTCATAESTATHASNTGKTREAGFTGGIATVTCHLAGDAAIDEGAVGQLQLLRDATDASKGLFGGVLCIGVDVGVDKDGIETITYTFQLTGILTGTVTEGTP